MTIEDEITRQRWAAQVTATIADHPDWVSTTIGAVQSGMHEALERKQERIHRLSMGLWQALSTSVRAKRREHETIIEAIEATNLHPTKWSAEAIAREEKNRAAQT